ncbi:hypothetical protein ABIB90_003001 [Bradyrhizobium sp. JR4.1]
MTIAKVEVERLSLRGSKPFDVVAAAFKSAVGQPDMVEFSRRRGRRIRSKNWSAIALHPNLTALCCLPQDDVPAPLAR